MSTDHSKQPKCCCTGCGKEFYVIYFNRHIKVCKHKNTKTKTEKVACPICGKRLKEINTAHLKTHGIDYNQAKSMFPDYNFLSENSLLKKATLTNLTPQQSENLKYGHTLKAKIEKWGEEGGLSRHLKSREAYSYSKTLEGYIVRLGEEEGRKQWESRIKNISRVQKDIWDSIPKSLRSRGTLDWYQRIYGEDEGKIKWLESCSNKSKSLRKIPIELARDFDAYKFLVARVTRSNLKLYGENLPLLEKRSRQLHLDHMYSVYQGFLDEISPYIVGFIGNLELMLAKENCSKQINCSQSLEELLNKINQNCEYQNIMSKDLLVINSDFNKILASKNLNRNANS